MTRPGVTAISRRAVLASGLAAAACRPPSTGNPAPPRKPAADAHTHFFNLADLPVSGFVTFVLIGQLVPVPPWAEALIDFITGFAKKLAKSAQEEAAKLGALNDLDPPTFGKAAADYVDVRLATAPASGGSGDRLPQSYEALLRRLTEETGTPAPQAGMAVPAAATDTKRTAFTRAARIEEFDETVSASGFSPVAAAGVVTRTIGWAYLMTKSRASHIDHYLSRQRSDDREIRAATSLLVDYDYWLDDTPAPGSAMLEQIRVMDLLRKRNGKRADIRLFAGVCPLRLAIERAARKSALFDAIKVEVAGGRAHGFKIYPPMGFQAAGNASLANSAFDAPPARRRSGWDQWKDATGDVADYALGLALDAALAEIYTHAAAHRIPIVAHAGPGMGAAPKYGDRANPKYWERVVKQHRIRLNLGHFVNDAKPFYEAVMNGADRTNVWSLDAPLRMFDRRQADPPDVYGDLAYMPELNDKDDCAKFFTALAKAFTPGDPNLERILFGTDWIMYGREPRSDRFLGNVEQGMRDARYSSEQIGNILWENAQRFLGPGA